MTKEDLLELKKWISSLSEEEKIERDKYLRGLATGEIQGPPVGYPSIDKVFLKNYEEKVLEDKIPNSSMYEYIYERNKDELSRVALQYFDKEITYKEFFENVDRVSSMLVQSGIKKGDIVTICMPTTPETVYLIYAINKIGAVSNMIDPRKSAVEIEKYINESKSKIFFGIDAVAKKYKNIKENTTAKEVVIMSPLESLSGAKKKLLSLLTNSTKLKVKRNNGITWSEFCKKFKYTKTEKENVLPDDEAIIVHTGGTTGVAKGVKLSNKNINVSARQCEVSGLDFEDRGSWYDIMPPFIAYGVGNGLHLPLSMGMKVIIDPKFNPKKLAKNLLKYKPNHMTGAPSHYGYLLKDKLIKDDTDLSFMKTPIVGGDKMDYELEKRVNEFLKKHKCLCKIIKGYGMSEVAAAISVCINNAVNKLKSVGIPLPKSNIGIYDPETNEELSYNQEGELRLQGPNIMLGYDNNPTEEEKVLKQDFGETVVHSGDLGYIDEDGVVFVKGRYKEMIIRPDGFKTYPSEIEEKILECPEIAECKVVGYRDEREVQGELPAAFMTIKPEYIGKEAEILEKVKNYCFCNMSEYTLPGVYQIKEKLPTTPLGKINILELKQEARKIGNETSKTIKLKK